MAKISDEIREFANTFYSGRKAYKTFTALADRIDRELMERPRTTDGAYIHVGDTAYLYDGRKVKVNDIKVNVDLETCDMERESYISTSPMNIANERPDSLESIASGLYDMVDDMLGQDTVTISTLSALRDFADRIRKLAEKEQNDE